MRPEIGHAAGDDGVRYDDGDVVHGGYPRPTEEFLRTKRTQVVGRRILSPLLCDVEEVRIYTNSTVGPDVEHARIKDCDDAQQIESVLSDVDEYLDPGYPTRLS